MFVGVEMTCLCIRSKITENGTDMRNHWKRDPRYKIRDVGIAYHVQ